MSNIGEQSAIVGELRMLAAKMTEWQETQALANRQLAEKLINRVPVAPELFYSRDQTSAGTTLRTSQEVDVAGFMETLIFIEADGTSPAAAAVRVQALTPRGTWLTLDERTTVTAGYTVRVVGPYLKLRTVFDTITAGTWAASGILSNHP